MAQNEINETNANDVQVKWFGDERAFSIGARPVKVWEIIVGLLVLTMVVPFIKK